MRFLLLMLALLLPAAVVAQTPPTTAAAPALVGGADELIAYLNGTGDFDALFAPVFRAAISREQLHKLVAQLADAYGRAKGIERLAPSSPWSADLRIAYERGTVLAKIGVDPVAPHQVSGLRITGAEARDDSLSKLDQDFAKLPGLAGFGIYALDAGGVRPIHELNGARAAPLGSAFKLWILAEAARQVNAGERSWRDVVPVGTPSLPSGLLQTWPAGTPMTLQALATLMISISDNTATDTLLATLGRDQVDAMVARVGTADPARTTPVLSTREMFAIKGARRDIAAAWPTVDVATRRKLLADNAAAIAAMPLSAETFRAGPVLTDTVEWFASPRDEARTLDWLRVHGGDTALAILAVSPGVQEPIKNEFAYLGFKGGSEPGVIALNYLLRDKTGRWLAVTANWHRSDVDVEATPFSLLAERALRLAIAR